MTMRQRKRRIGLRAHKSYPSHAKFNKYGKWFDKATNTLWYRDLRSYYENS